MANFNIPNNMVMTESQIFVSDPHSMGPMTNSQRTSDSLNEGLPIKMTREKFQRKLYFFYEKDSRFNTRLIHKNRFLTGQVPIEKYGLKTLFLLFTI